MSFQWPYALLALAAVPIVLAARYALHRRRTRYAVRFTNLEVLAGVAEETTSRRAWIAPALFLLALVSAGVALARPEVTRSVPDERATIVLVVDSSGSMSADDVQPTRLTAAQNAVRAFLDTLPKRPRVGLITFSSVPVVAAAPTHDRRLVRSALGFFVPGGGTSIGDAIVRAIEVAREGVGPVRDDAPGAAPAAIVLLSDGAQRRGIVQPLDSAQRARRAGIPIYTVALGTPGGVVMFTRDGFSQLVPVPPDPETLRQMAATSRGKFYEVTDAKRLSDVYRGLGSRLGRKRTKEETTFLLAAAAAALLLASAAASAAWSQRIP